MDWRSFLRVLCGFFSTVFIVLRRGFHAAGRWAWQWILRHTPEADDTASIQFSNQEIAENERENNTMATQPMTQEAPGAPPELPEPVQPPPEPQIFAAWWTDLEEYAAKNGSTFEVWQARALYKLSTRTLAPAQEASESGAEG